MQRECSSPVNCRAATCLLGAAIIGIAGATLMGAAAASAGRTQWDIVSISGSSQFNPATNIYSGSGSIVIDGTSSAVTWESVVLGTLSQDSDGTLHLIGSHTFVSDVPGRRFEFTTFDKVTAVPTAQPGVFQLTSHLTIEDGAGLFAQGQIVASGGTLDVTTGAISIPAAVGKLARN